MSADDLIKGRIETHTERIEKIKTYLFNSKVTAYEWHTIRHNAQEIVRHVNAILELTGLQTDIEDTKDE